MRSFLVGFYVFATFFFVLACSLDSIAAGAAFAVALAAALTVQATVFALRSWRRRQLAEPPPAAGVP